MAKKPDSQASSPAADDTLNMSYEDAVEALEGIIERIESGSIGLEDSIEAYERGTKLIRRCRSLLDAAEQRVRELNADELDGGSDGNEPA
ncbi:MAG: exodeoxyribonuclease VII small subunit [Phycisphaerae bacterium]|nr:exodeoxyribonuclease VII small subunit [Phycisphaerae bacterium]|tara:strand:- start:474 stop:743 length:270 start_codon:yes stop_codon:yes gene_type:complete